MVTRYHRQTLLSQIGEVGQRRLGAARVLLVGCGALGTVIADQLVRAGVGFVRLCDRDLVELTNLQRQVLFDESDAAAGLPKAVAAANRLARINSTVAIKPHVVDVHSGNIESLLDGIDLALDGTDNVETRYLLNDACVKRNVPWVYGACVGTTGRVMGIMPGGTARGGDAGGSPCLRCLFPDPPGPGDLATCDTAGVLGAASNVVASLQVAEAMKILLADASAATELTTIDLWPVRVRTISTRGARREECQACGLRRFEFLDVRPGATATSLCGRNTVQVRPPAANRATIDLKAITQRLSTAGDCEQTSFFVRCALRESGLTLTLFPDGRGLVHGTSDVALARSVYARFVGS
ncbi:MAG: ThiF family adenylyltransferase [Tepidisphaeraceae bacterium]